MSGHRFDAVLGGGDAADLPAVVLPPDLAAAMGGRARIPVAGTINGVPFRGSTMPMGDGTHCVGFRKDTRAQAGGVELGDTVTIEIARDERASHRRRPRRPGRGARCRLGRAAAFDAMSYTHRKEYVGAVQDAKRPETRARRLAKAVEAARARM